MDFSQVLVSTAGGLATIVGTLVAFIFLGSEKRREKEVDALRSQIQSLVASVQRLEVTVTELRTEVRHLREDREATSDRRVDVFPLTRRSK